MKYIQYINQLIKEAVNKNDSLIMFGQNISTGSCLSGLTRGIKNDDKHWILNTPNSENTLVGVGFGLMLKCVSSIFFMKQQDFLLLGIDQLVNTYNFVRIKNPNASFSIVMIVVDTGYQGIQSSFNSMQDICSIARIPGYTINNQHDADYILNNLMISRGLRLIGVSQRLFGEEIIKLDNEVIINNNGDIIQYSKGDNATVICFNFSFLQGYDLYNKLHENGIKSSLFSVNNGLPVDWSVIIDDIKRSKKVIIIDDSKTVNSTCFHLKSKIHETIKNADILLLKKENSDELLCPNSEEFNVNFDQICRFINTRINYE